MHGIKNLFSLFFLFCLVMNNCLNAMESNTSINDSLNAMESNTSIDKGMSLEEKIVSQMSPRQKLGQMLMMRFRRWAEDGEDNDNNANFVNVVELNDDIKSIIKDYCIGNIVLFSENFSNEEEDKEKAKERARTLVKGFKDLTVDIDIKVDKVKNLNVKIPMIVATDQEGGKVQRILFNGRHKNNSEIKSKEEANDKGKTIGRELFDLGINCNLGPVADVNSNPENLVIGDRSFGDNPEYVAECCANFLKGLREYGILGTAKHFPGHGDISIDSHLSLPGIEKSEEELQSCELIPFKSLINQNIDMIMTAHILLKKIDEKYPATLSSKILTDMLRKKMGYTGVIITDSMGMGAITNNFGELEACKLAIQAGADILCMPEILKSKKDMPKLEGLYSYLENEIKNNLEFKVRVDESVTRILKLKSRLKSNI